MIKTIDIPKETIISTVTSPSNSAILNLKYQEGNRLICMYDNSIYCIQNEKSEELVNFNQENKKIVFADIELANFIFRITEKNVLLRTESTIELTNVANGKTNIYTIDSVVKEVYGYDNHLAINLGSEVHFIGTNGWLKKKYNSSQEVRKIVMNSSFAGIVYRDKIEIVEL